jgi:hypothetical protein
MSLIQHIPESLKPQEVERGSGRFVSPISFVPEKLDEIDPDRKVPTIKIELDNGVESRIEVWEGIGTKEQFLCHMINMREALHGMGLFVNYEEARKRVSDLTEERKELKALADVVAVDNTPLEADKASLHEELARHNEVIKELKAAVAEAKQEQVAAMAAIFSTTANFLRGDGKVPWDRIVTEQTEKDPWTNLLGVEKSGVRGKTMAAWEDCFMLMLKTVFPNNAAEQQKFYLTLLRYSPKQTVRAFLQRATTLARYVIELPSILHSCDETDATKAVEPYGDGELATIMLHAMPYPWQTQYNLLHKAPHSIPYLQDALEKIAEANPLGGDKGTSKNKVSFSKMTKMTDKIPKKKSHAAKHEKPASAKSCALCKKYGGASNTHNTQECKKYDHQGNLKKGFKGRKDFSTNSTPPGASKSYAQLYAETKKLKSSNKKFKRALKKSSKKHKKRKYASSSESDSSDSDSE